MTELAVLLIAVVAALGFLRFYLLRAVEGGAYQTASGLGNQFNPTGEFSEQRATKIKQQVNTQVVPASVPDTWESVTKFQARSWVTRNAAENSYEALD